MMNKNKKKKKCIKCGKEKIITKEFSQRRNYNGTEKIYYKSHCKSCCVEHSGDWVTKNREKFNKYQREYHKNRRNLLANNFYDDEN